MKSLRHVELHLYRSVPPPPVGQTEAVRPKLLPLSHPSILRQEWHGLGQMFFVSFSPLGSSGAELSLMYGNFGTFCD